MIANDDITPVTVDIVYDTYDDDAETLAEFFDLARNADAHVLAASVVVADAHYVRATFNSYADYVAYADHFGFDAFPDDVR